jgi:epoxide hydrolase-like predicted phosphatase
MSAITAIISDFGGVLTSPLLRAFQAFHDRADVPLEELGTAMAAIAERDGANPLYELEKGHITEARFLGDLAAQLRAQLGREVDMDGFAERYFEQLTPNQALIDYMRDLRDRGYKMAICTNNVREWEPLWRAMLPIDEIFDVVVDSAFVGFRKPEAQIYEITLHRLGIEARAAVFVDDLELNCSAARDLGMAAVWFRDSEQAIIEIDTALGR